MRVRPLEMRDTSARRLADHAVAPAAIYVAGFMVLHLLSWQATSHLELRPDIVRPPFAGDWLFGGWNLWDGEWYLRIAAEGYSYTPGEQSSVAFFPAYPVLARAVGRSIDNLALGAMAVTVMSGVGAFLAFRRWCLRHLRSAEPLLAVLLLATFPYAFYLYGAVYSDALFLVLALLAFLFVERGNTALAVLAAAAATATRLVGVGVAVGVVLLALERSGALRWERWRPHVQRRALRWRDLALGLSITGLVAWAAFLWHRFGDPLAFWTVQAAWDQGSGIRTWFKVDLFTSLWAAEDLRYSLGCLLQGTGAIAALAAVPGISRRFGLPYGAYVLTTVALPAIGSKDFQGLGRYLLAAFPAFAFVGERLDGNRPLFRRVVTVSTVLLLFHAVLFFKGEYIA